MKLTRTLAIAAFALAPLANAAPVQASALQDAYFDHLEQCIHLLLTDPIEQARVCGTGNGPSGRTLPAYTPPPAPTKPPVEECPVWHPGGLMAIMVEGPDDCHIWD